MLNNIGLPGLILLVILGAVIVALLMRPKSSDRPRGSAIWLLFWAVVFFPLAIIYALMRRWHDPDEKQS